MPKKPNSHGDLQNYVPPGNGDASGEYADGEGSNVHYFDPETFGKGKGEEPKAEEPKEGHIEVSKGEPKGGNFSKYLDTFKEDKGVTRDGLKGVYETGTDDAKGVVDALIADGYGIKPIKGRDKFDGKGVNLSKGTVEGESARNNGEVFYHEFHHAVDNWLAKDVTEEEYEEALPSIIGTRKAMSIPSIVDAAEAKRYGSATIKTSNGKTLYQTIVDEIDRNKAVGVSKDYKNEQDAVWRAAVGMTMAERNKKENEARDRIANQAKSEGFTEWTHPYWERIRQLYEQDTEYKKLHEAWKQGNAAEKELNKDWLSISDICEGAGWTSFCAGHGRSYWRSGMGKGSRLNRGLEFLAEYGSAYSRRNGNGKHELELLRKYFPESSKAAEELCERAIKKSKGEK